MDYLHSKCNAVQAIREKCFSQRIFMGFIHIVCDIVREPVFSLFVIACFIYFIPGEISEGIMMGVAMIIVAAIFFTRK